MLAHSPQLRDTAIGRLVCTGRWSATLPSELEWEKAARGGLSDAVFSWGDNPDPERASHGDTGIGDTSVVGCFPANGLGLYDTIGNVWEWTRSLWGKDPFKAEFGYPYDPNDARREALDAGDEIARVGRGGAWGGLGGFARCACRYGDLPDYRLDYLGFRVVLRRAPVR